MISFTKTISESERRDGYLDLRDDQGQGHGEHFPPDGQRLVIRTGRLDYEARMDGRARIGGDLRDWYEDEDVHAGSVVRVTYDKNARSLYDGLVPVSIVIADEPVTETPIEIRSRTAEEIVTMVHERGELSKRDVLEYWGLSESEYPELQALVLAMAPELEKGPQRTGGFNVKERRIRLPGDDVGDDVLLRDGWEKDAADRLATLAPHAQLERLLGRLAYTVRQIRKVETGDDRRGTKLELATNLILIHGIDLLADKQIREVVARCCRIRCPGKWHPGKDSAISFVQETGFPPELAGIPTTERRPDYEYLEGRVRLGELKPFQREVKQTLRQRLDSRCGRAIVTLPTGAGKTRVAVECIRDWLSHKNDVSDRHTHKVTVLWLAHTEELCEQAYTCFKDVWESSECVSPLLLIRFWKHYTRDIAQHRETLKQLISTPSVLVSTPQRVVNMLEGSIPNAEGVVRDLKVALGLLVIDEAHRAAAPSYRKIIRALVNGEEPAVVAGLTATPFRKEYLPHAVEDGTRDLKEIFQFLIEPQVTLGTNPRRKLEEMGVLAKPIFRTIRTRTSVKVPDVSEPALTAIEEAERIDRILRLGVDKAARRLEILKYILPIAEDPDNSILYFGPSVLDAQCMAFLLRRARIPAGVVHGGTRDVTRRQIISQFKSESRDGRLRVLCNCEVLTTGFDAPRVSHIVIARPTVSRVLYEQMIGRGLRGPEFGGTSTCVVLDCEDEFRGRKLVLGYEEFRELWQGNGLTTSPTMHEIRGGLTHFVRG